MLKISLFLLAKRNQLLVVFVLWVLLVLLINPVGEFPCNDDWAYAQSVKALVETRTFFMSGWTSVNLFVQIGWGALFCIPFGFSFTALRISTLVAGLFGLWGTHRLIYNSTENGQTAFLGTLLTLVNPMYLGLSASFMTDVPFYALAVWSLAYMVDGLKRAAVRPMLMGLGLAVIALLTRQLGIALFAGFSVAYIARKGISLKSIGVACISVAVGLGVQMAYQRWLHHMMPGIVSYNVQATNFLHLSFYTRKLFHIIFHNTFIGLMYVGLFLFPYFLVLLTKNSLSAFRKNRWLWLLLAVLVISMWYYFFDGINMPIWWNILNAFGLGPMLLRDLYFGLYGLPFPEFLHVLMLGVTIGSLLGSVGVLYYLIRTTRYLMRWPIISPERAVGLLLFSVVGIYFLPMGMQGLFDRYLLPLPVLLLILIYLLHRDSDEKKPERPLRVPLYLSVSLFALYLGFSVCATHDYLAWNRVRWQSLNNLMRQGAKPTDIDGGFEFNGFYLYDAAYKPTPAKSWWWVHKDTYMIGASLLPGYTLFGRHKVNAWFPWGIQEIIVGKKTPGVGPKLIE